MSLGDRTARRHLTAGVDPTDYWAFPPGTRVLTVEGLAGTVESVEDGPHPGSEAYIVRLDADLGGGAYAPGELRAAPLAPASAALTRDLLQSEEEADLGAEATFHTAADDYPELENILVERPPLQHAVTAAKKMRHVASLNAEGIQVEAGPIDWFADRINKNLPPEYQADALKGERWSMDWCRFRKRRRCWYPKELNAEATKEAGYAVWVPFDRGICPRDKWAEQEVCPVSEPGPNSGHPNAGVDATRPWESGGQRGGRIGSLQAEGAYVWPDTGQPISDEDILELAEVNGYDGDLVLAHGDKKAFQNVSEWVKKHVLYPMWARGDLDIRNVPFEPEPAPKPDPSVLDWALQNRVLTPTAALLKQADLLELDPANPTAGEQEVLDLIAANSFEYVGLAIKAVDSGRVLLDQRTPYEGDDEGVYGRWEFPGGKIEDGENPLEAARREFSEETGLDLPSTYRIAGGLTNGNYLLVVMLVPSEAWTVDANLLDFEVMGLGWFHPDQVEGTDLIREEMDNTEWDMIREARKTDPEFTFHFTAAWSDVRAKAKRIRSEGGVRIISVPGGSTLSVTAEVNGENAVYQTTINYAPNSRTAVAMWECGCAWASYSWGRTGRWKRFEGRMCSHALAVTFEAQSQGMFGREISEQAETPTWRRDPTQVVRQPTNYPKPKRRAASVDPDLADPPILTMAQALLGDGEDPNTVLAYLTENGAPGLITQALKAPSGFKVKVRGWVTTLVELLDDGMALLGNGQKVRPSEVLYPTFDPMLGLDLRDSQPHVSSKVAYFTEDSFTADVMDKLMTAMAYESEVSPILQRIAGSHGGKMEGFNFRFKAYDSLARKVLTKMRTKKVDAGTAVKSINDALRYTIVFPADKYVRGAGAVLEALRAARFPVMEGGFKNYWLGGDPYQGINLSMLTSSGFPWELQIHTPESFAHKEVNHKLYETMQDRSGNTTPQQRRDAWDAMTLMSFKLPVPATVSSIGFFADQPRSSVGSKTAADSAYRYFTQDASNTLIPTTVYRMYDGDDDVRFEFFDPETREWVLDMSLGRHLAVGGTTHDEITEADALRLTFGVVSTGAMLTDWAPKGEFGSKADGWGGSNVIWAGPNGRPRMMQPGDYPYNVWWADPSTWDGGIDPDNDPLPFPQGSPEAAPSYVVPSLDEVSAALDGDFTEKALAQLAQPAWPIEVEAGAAEGLEADLVRSFQGRDVPDSGERVTVYRDLSGAPKSGYPARESWSIKRQKSGDVVSHTQGLRIVNVRPTFLEGARKQFQRTVKRGVHAFLEGTVDDYVRSGSGRPVSYYPDLSVFFFKDNRREFVSASAITFSKGKCYAEGGVEGNDVMPRSRFEACWDCNAGPKEPCPHEAVALWGLEMADNFDLEATGGLVEAGVAEDAVQMLHEGFERGEVAEDRITWYAPTDAGQSLAQGDLGVHAELHEEEEPALPFTTADDEEVERAIHAAVVAEALEDESPIVQEAVAEVVTEGLVSDPPGPGDPRLGWLMSGSPQAGASDTLDVAAAARAFLAKESMKVFSPTEQAEIIGEGEGVTASNLDRLNIAGTHYEALEANLDGEEDMWL